MFSKPPQNLRFPLEGPAGGELKWLHTFTMFERSKSNHKEPKEGLQALGFDFSKGQARNTPCVIYETHEV